MPCDPTFDVRWHDVSHTKHWAATQKHVTLLSGGAELGGVVNGAAEELGVQSLAWDIGLHLELAVHAETAAQPVGSASGQASDVCGTWL